MKYPKISVIIPNFNYGNYLEEAILSVLNQSYPAIELIIIDGGSTDNSIEIIKKYESSVNYWVSEKDSGQADAINKGLKVCTGDYVCFLNSDDAFIGKTLESIFSTIHSSSVDFLFGEVYIGENTQSKKMLKGNKEQMLLRNLLLFFYNVRFIIPSQSVFINRHFLEKNNIKWVDPNLHYCMDMEWYCRISLHSPTYQKYHGVYSFFRVHPKTKTKSKSDHMRYEAIKIALKYLPHLNSLDQKRFHRYLFYSKVLRLIYKNKILFNHQLISGLLGKTGVFPVFDKRFWGLYKVFMLKSFK